MSSSHSSFFSLAELANIQAIALQPFDQLPFENENDFKEVNDMYSSDQEKFREPLNKIRKLLSEDYFNLYVTEEIVESKRSFVVRTNPLVTTEKKANVEESVSGAKREFVRSIRNTIDVCTMSILSLSSAERKEYLKLLKARSSSEQLSEQDKNAPPPIVIYAKKHYSDFTFFAYPDAKATNNEVKPMGEVSASRVSLSRSIGPGAA